MAALDRAIALAERECVPLLVREDLDLDVPGIDEKLLQIDRVVAERVLGLQLRGLERPRHLVLFVDHAHAPPAAARRGLDDDGIADALGRLARLLLVLHRPRAAGDDRHAVFDHQLAGLRLVAHQRDALRRGTDEREPRRPARLGELRVLGEESVSGMNRLGAGNLRRAEDVGDVAVAEARVGGADAHLLVGKLDRQTRGIRLGIRHNGLDAEVPARPQDP